jgi:hypothetical protein
LLNGPEKKERQFLPPTIVHGRRTVNPREIWLMNLPPAGLPDFSFYKIPKRGKNAEMPTNYNKWPQSKQFNELK